MMIVELIWLLPLAFVGMLLGTGVYDGYMEMRGEASPDREQPFMPDLLSSK